MASYLIHLSDKITNRWKVGNMASHTNWSQVNITNTPDESLFTGILVIDEYADPSYVLAQVIADSYDDQFHPATCFCLETQEPVEFTKETFARDMQVIWDTRQNDFEEYSRQCMEEAAEAKGYPVGIYPAAAKAEDSVPF